MENLFKNFKSDIKSEPPIESEPPIGPAKKQYSVDRYNYDSKFREMRCFNTISHRKIERYLREKGLLPLE